MNAWYQKVNQDIKIHFLFFVLHLEIKKTVIFHPKTPFYQIKNPDLALVSSPNRRDYSI